MRKIKTPRRQESEKISLPQFLARSLFHCFNMFKRCACFHWLACSVHATVHDCACWLPVNNSNIDHDCTALCFVFYCNSSFRLWSVAQLCMKAQVEFGGDWVRKRCCICGWMILPANTTRVPFREAKPALSTAFSVTDTWEVLSEHERASTQWRIQLQQAAHGIGWSMDLPYRGLRLLKLDRRRPMFVGILWPMAVVQPTYRIWLSWQPGFPPEETEVNLNIETFLCGEVGFNDRCSVYAEQRTISVALAGMAGTNLSTDVSIFLEIGDRKQENNGLFSLVFCLWGSW